MTELMTSSDLGHVAHQLGLPLAKVQRTVELLDEGNTVPFITRYRKDETGGLDEEQIRQIQLDVAKQRQLADRKATILKSIESQGKLTPELLEQIRVARSPKHLEDLYLPYKPKKQTLATVARQRGLEPLAGEVLAGSPEAADLTARAAQFLAPDQKLSTVDDVLAGVRHILAEQFSERADLRSRLRRVLQRTGKLVSARVEPEKRVEAALAAAAGAVPQTNGTPATMTLAASDATAEPVAESLSGGPPASGEAAPLVAVHDVEDAHHDHQTPGDLHDDVHDDMPADLHGDDEHDDELHAGEHDEEEDVDLHEDDGSGESLTIDSSAEESTTAAQDSDLGGVVIALTEGPPSPTVAADGQMHVAEGGSVPHAPGSAILATSVPPLRLTARQQARAAAREAKKKKKQKLLESLYKDYYKYEEPLSKVPPHRVLAINRGERSHVLRVKIVADDAAIEQEALALLVPAGHPHAEFLQGCVRDALVRLVVPSLEREIRREMTERAEQHAVEVFVRNLRKLLLQPPVHGRRVLAIDPGFRSGCKLAALDEFGNLLDHGTIHIIGPEPHRQMCRQRLVDSIVKHQLSVIAIGNGTACRETEVLVADVLAHELHDRDVAYVIVNEAGASVYSTSPIGREELPKYDATVRGAVSIGRRLLDPLSELVKINPANIGVGLYQHDLKAKHLRDSLDAVVESCVNYVGVEVNTASPALLRYVSGLNQLTARRLYEHRLQHGPFRNREQFKQVPGFGDATFIQAAGFLKICGGDNPLDATWIHPESYEVARHVLTRLDSSEAELAAEVAPTRSAVPVTAPAPAAFGGGELLASATAAEATVAIEASPAIETVPAVESSPAIETVSAVETAPAIETVSAVESSPVAEALLPPESRPAVDGATTTAEPSSAEESDPAPVDAPIADVAAAVAQAIKTESEPVDGLAPDDPAAPKPEPLAVRIDRLDVEGLAGELQIGTLALRDILASLARPNRDPREDLSPPIFRRGIMKLEDLTSGMELSGTVLNVVDFGVFVDIGLSDSALIHISRLADRFIRDPHEVVGVGDVLKVWVVDVDKQRRRVSLTAIQPGTEKPREARPPRRPRPEKTAQRPAAQQGAAQRPPPRPGSAATVGPGARRPPLGPAPQGGRPRQHQPPKFTRPPQKAQPPKPVPPITKDMIDGKEPMRTFSDLLQFYKKKKDEPEEK